MKTLEGMYDGKGLKIAIVASRFNEFITTKLVGGAEDCLLRHGTDGDSAGCQKAGILRQV